MTLDMYIYNELADEAARIASNTFGSTTAVKDDAAAKRQVRKIALRLAAIEASTWTEENDFNESHGKDFELLRT